MLKILIENSALQASKLYLIEWDSLEYIKRSCKAKNIYVRLFLAKSVYKTISLF